MLSCKAGFAIKRWDSFYILAYPQILFSVYFAAGTGERHAAVHLWITHWQRVWSAGALQDVSLWQLWRIQWQHHHACGTNTEQRWDDARKLDCLGKESCVKREKSYKTSFCLHTESTFPMTLVLVFGVVGVVILLVLLIFSQQQRWEMFRKNPDLQGEFDKNPNLNIKKPKFIVYDFDSLKKSYTLSFKWSLHYIIRGNLHNCHVIMQIITVLYSKNTIYF